jgi:hypothetical protein
MARNAKMEMQSADPMIWAAIITAVGSVLAAIINRAKHEK